MLVNPLRVRHVLQHDFAHLQRRLSEPDFEDLDVSPLRVTAQRDINQGSQGRDENRGSHLVIKIPILNRQQSLRQQNLQLFDKQILRVIDTDEGTDRIRRFVRSKVRACIDWFWFPIRVGIVLHLDLREGLNGFIDIRQRITTFLVSHKIGDNTSDRVWPTSDHQSQTRKRPQVRDVTSGIFEWDPRPCVRELQEGQ